MFALALSVLLFAGQHAVDTPVKLPAPAKDADFHANGAPNAAKVELGRLLFFDKVLSGNRNISCATCHHPQHSSSDAVALSLGEGPQGLGPKRREGEELSGYVAGRVPRNAPALFNLGAREFTRLFHDGRVEVDLGGHYESGFITPAKWKFPVGLESALAAQAMFPPTSPIEMAGQQGENEIADARARNQLAGPNGVWAALGKRLQGIPEYVDRFRAAFPGEVLSIEDVTYVRAANAIAAFEATAFRADDSAFDRFLRGEAKLAPKAERGMQLFYGRANCVRCHSGTFQTDHDFHAIAVPQIGPGTSDGHDSSYWSGQGERAFIEDFGRGRVTARVEDRFRFRTPTLRNVTQTGPWGHDGAFERLEDVVRHHLDPLKSLETYRLRDGQLSALDNVVEVVAKRASLRLEPLSERRRSAFLARDGWIQENAEMRSRIAAANELEKLTLSDSEVADLIAFLESLTDARDLEALVPERVPSGLPVED